MNHADKFNVINWLLFTLKLADHADADKGKKANSSRQCAIFLCIRREYWMFFDTTVPLILMKPINQKQYNAKSRDRGKKFILYRKLASLEEYVLIDPREYHVELSTTG